MKLTSRERILIGLAVLLAIIVGIAKFLPASRPVPWLWPDREAALSRLARAQRLVRSADTVRARVDEARELEAALTLAADPKERGTAAVNELSRAAQDFGLKPLELKPGLGRQEGGLWVLPVQLRTRAPAGEIMALVAGCKNRLPMTRIVRLSMVPKDMGTAEAVVLMEFLFPAWEEAGKKQGSRLPPATLTAAERIRYVNLLRARLAEQPDGRLDDWARLARAIGAFGSAAGTGQEVEFPGPRFLGVVAVGEETKALLGLGAESWYLSPGEAKAGIVLLDVGPDTATVRYRGQVRRLKLATEFAVTPLDRR